MSLGGQLELPVLDDVTIAIATAVTEAIYSAPYHDATGRQQDFALRSARLAVENLRALGCLPPQENR